MYFEIKQIRAIKIISTHNNMSFYSRTHKKNIQNYFL